MKFNRKLFIIGAILFCIFSFIISKTLTERNFIDTQVNLFTKNCSKDDSHYINVRNNLIERYGIEETYKILGFTLENIKNVSSYTLTEKDSFISNVIPNKGILTIKMYTNSKLGLVDLWYEMNYKKESSGTFPSESGDIITINFENNCLKKFCTTHSSNIKNYIDNDKNNEAIGQINWGSAYANIIVSYKVSGESNSLKNLTYKGKIDLQKKVCPVEFIFNLNHIDILLNKKDYEDYILKYSN